ncbi:hypothetical protein Q765_01720 [Flavobacterium rivuli WB 3.3-2 = DSM 21788]|uniref:histidine kinase n=1 Tax=Flavobacterium rivuli WB 3.3-2 = DSM 21788 TaxID=1121895 RepID=A0A0A2MK15_9FLAO|nr:histidine kinase dimerization/phosphoacceptor domain -containing protein [Flavobacterium rivuli]KGO88645.1 hypothetical protein Q765_01720 [Flavobacterium rivuli WB 3.3-2 = DSM 21788]
MVSKVNVRGVFYGLLLLLSTTISVNAQSPQEVAKLKQQLEGSNDNTKKVTLLLALGKYSLYKEGEYKIDLDSARAYTNEARSLSETLHYKAGIGRSILQDARIYREGGNKKKAWQVANNALTYFTVNNMPVLKGDTYLELRNHLTQDEKDIEKQIKYTNLAIGLYKKSGSKEKQANTLIDLSDLYQAKSDLNKSLHLLQESLAIYKNIKFKRLQGVYIYMADAYRLSNNNDLSIKYALMAVKTAEDLHDNSMQLCMIYNHVGLIYFDVKNFEEALVYFKKALNVAYQHNDNRAVNELSHNIASILYRKHRDREAIDLLNIAVTKYPSDNSDVQVVINQFFTICYLRIKDYNNAKIYYNKLLQQYGTTTNANIYRGYLYKGIITYLRETGQVTRTYKYLEEYKNYCVGNKYLHGLAEMEFSYFKSDSASGNLSGAIDHLKKYHYLRDSTISVSRTKQVSALQIQYETEKKDKNIIVLKELSKLQESKLHNSTIIQYVFAGGLLLSTLFIGLLYYAYRLKQRTNKKLELKRQQIDEQNALLKKLLTEKEWLLKEIHHRVKNNLQIVISLLNTQSSFLENKEALAAIQNSQHRMHAMSLIHQRLYQSENLASINMSWYINELVSYLKECLGSDKKIKFILDNEAVELDVAQAVPLGLILNEAISNAIKYAFPDKDRGTIEISLKRTEGTNYQLIVADDGVGLPENADLQNSNSLGMNLMAGLSQQLDGSFSIKNDNGVNVAITFTKNNNLGKIDVTVPV